MPNVDLLKNTGPQSESGGGELTFELEIEKISGNQKQRFQIPLVFMFDLESLVYIEKLMEKNELGDIVFYIFINIMVLTSRTKKQDFDTNQSILKLDRKDRYFLNPLRYSDKIRYEIEASHWENYKKRMMLTKSSKISE